jgi:hypothetical protein
VLFWPVSQIQPGIPDRVDADRDQHHLVIEPLAEPVLQLAEHRRQHRAYRRTGGIDEVHHHDAVADHVADELDLVAVLIEQYMIEQLHFRGLGRRSRLFRHRLVLGVRIVRAGRIVLVLLVRRFGGLQVQRQQARRQYQRYSF